MFKKSFNIVFILSISLIFTYSFYAEASVALIDIAGHKYESSIKYLKNKSIIKGYSDGAFKPNDTLNRAEMLKIIMEGYFSDDELDVGRNCFKDVKAQWFAQYICDAKEKGVVKGYANGFFRPSREVNWAEALKMAIKTFEQSTDEYEGGEWFTPYIEFAHHNNIFSKYSYIKQ